MKFSGLKNTLKFRLSFFIGAAILLAGSLVAASLLARYWHEQKAELGRHAMWLAGNVAFLYAGGRKDGASSSVAGTVEAIVARDREVAGEPVHGPLEFIDIIDKNGVPEASASRELDKGVMVDIDASRSSDARADSPFTRTMRFPDGCNMIVSVYPVFVDGRRVGAVRAGLGDGLLRRDLAGAAWQAAGAVFIASLIGVFLGGRIAEWVLRPVRALAAGSAGLSHGGAGMEMPVKAPRELEQLAGSLNEMAVSLRDKMKSLEKSRKEAESLSGKLTESYGDARHTAERLQETNEWVTDLAFKLEEANQKLKAEKVQTETIVHSIRDGIVALDKDENIILVNPEAEEIFGVKAEDVRGSHVQALVDSLAQRIEEPGEFIKKFMAAVPVPEVESTFTVTLTKPYRRVLRRLSSAIHDESGLLIGRVVTFRDVTREKEVDEMKSNFVSTVSHELRTPLTSIKGALNLLIGGQIEDAETKREFIKIAEQNTDRLISLISNLLDLSRMEEGRVKMKFRKLDLNAVVRSVMKSAGILARQDWVSLEATYTDKALKVMGDREKLEQLVTNLVGNAIKFSDPGGVVRVSTSLREDEARLVVEDDGVGIPKDKLDRIFDRFYQADMSATRRIGGTGLGLSICRTIVKEHAGAIWAESPVAEDGRGARLVVVIPRMELPAMPGAGRSKPALSRSTGLKTKAHEDLVLLVDDDTSILELHKRSFEHEGYRVVTAANGRDALRAARENLPGLILLDVVLPDLDGFDVASMLKSDDLTREIPIVFTSGLGEKARGRGMDLGNGYLSKPFRQDQLISEVKKILK